MRVIIISYGRYLEQLLPYLNTNLDIAKIILMDRFFVGDMTLSPTGIPVSSYAFLKETLNDCYYDFILVAAVPWSEEEGIILDDLKQYGIYRKKIFRVGALYTHHIVIFNVLKKYIMENAKKYKTFCTGISRTWRGIDLSCFSLPAVCCAFSSQDLYYDYVWAKYMLSLKNANFKYAVIGITEYSFQYDETIGSNESFMILPYYLTFKDTHNYHVDDKRMKEIFNTKLLSIDQNIDIPSNIDINNLDGRLEARNIGIIDLMKGRANAEKVLGKRYPETISEYKEIFIKYITLCKENGVTPIVTLIPTSEIRAHFFPKAIRDEYHYIMRNMQKEYDFIYLDESYFKDFKEDLFMDDDHLNTEGAKKCSNIINDVICKLEQKN